MLRSNEIFAALYNMIISQEVFAAPVAGLKNDLVDAAKVDGSLYGDTKLYYSTDALKSAVWGNDAEATNLLALHRPSDPEVQAITLDQFRQISLTVDDYLTKRAFADEGTFSAFNSVLAGWIGDTKKIYDHTLYNAFIGTEIADGEAQTITVSGVSEAQPADEASARLEAMKLAEKVANILDELSDVSRDYNDYGFLRSVDPASLKVVWNDKYVNRIRKIDLPTIFNQAGLDATTGKYRMPAKYFGTVNGEATKGNGTTVRSLIEQDIGDNHYFAGDLIKDYDTAPAKTSYTEDGKVICKIIGKLPPYMSAFEVGTDFFNAKSLTTNKYLTFGHNTLVHLREYPYITLKSE